MRKKLSDMTPIERVDQRMKGMTWDEAEEVGVEILARCLTHHIFVAGDGEEFAESLPKRVAKRVREMVEEHRTAFALLRAKEKEFTDEMDEFKELVERDKL